MRRDNVVKSCEGAAAGLCLSGCCEAVGLTVQPCSLQHHEEVEQAEGAEAATQVPMYHVVRFCASVLK